MFRTKRVSAFAGLTAAALLVTGCTGKQTAAPAKAASIDSCDPKGMTISVAYASQGAPAAKLAKKAVEKSYPGLTVDLRPASTSSYDELTQQIVADNAAGARPDIAMVGLGQVRFWVDQFHPQELDAKSLPKTYDNRFLKIGAVEGKNYVVPFQASIPVLYTNTTTTKSAGIDKVPTTTGELLDNARAIKKATGAAPLQFPRDRHADWIAQALIESGGETFINKDGTPGFDTAKGRNALSVYAKAGAEGLQDPVSLDDAVNSFHAGRLAYLVTTSAWIPDAQKAIGDRFDWTISAMPVPDGGTASLPAGGNGWLVLSDDPCRAAFSHEVMSELVSPDIIEASAREYSYIPVDTEAAARLAADPGARTQLGFAWTYPETPTTWGGWHGDSTPRVNKFLEDMVQRLTNGESVDKVLPETTRQISSAVH